MQLKLERKQSTTMDTYREKASADSSQIGGGHYASEYQHWNLVADLSLDYYDANSTKYMTRHRSKNGVQDVQKAGHYIEKKMELIEERRLPPPLDYAPHIYIARVKIVEAFCRANKIDDEMDRAFMDLVLLAREFRDFAQAKLVLKEIAAKYPPTVVTNASTTIIAPAPSTLISATGGRYRPSAQFTLEGYKGDRDCWQCRKCFAHFELKADSNPEVHHTCDSQEDGATAFYVDQARDDRLASQA